MAYPSDWDERRRRVYRRDNYTCQRCGRQGGTYGNTELHCHHIKPIGQGGGHHLGNLITLCDRCHKSVHGVSSFDKSGPSGPESTRAYSRIKKWAYISIGFLAITSLISWYIASFFGFGDSYGVLWLVLILGIPLGWTWIVKREESSDESSEEQEWPDPDVVEETFEAICEQYGRKISRPSRLEDKSCPECSGRVYDAEIVYEREPEEIRFCVDCETVFISIEEDVWGPKPIGEA